ncbi:MAG: YhfC family intramembrane metalloprotease, partial [Ruminococcaceae bacterium]|nr:YhfC family intramembrane metalloprotease [Oscillospiraceae bacterium]
MFGSQTIAALFVGGLLALIIPIAAAVVFKLKNRETWLPSVFIGAGTFFVFALILEQLLHAVMRPIVQGNVLLTCVYGALAAGIFEETGRFVAYKTLMKKRYATKNAVYMGIGHGGCEAIVLVGINFISYAFIALAVNVLGVEQFIQMS